MIEHFILLIMRQTELLKNERENYSVTMPDVITIGLSLGFFGYLFCSFIQQMRKTNPPSNPKNLSTQLACASKQSIEPAVKHASKVEETQRRKDDMKEGFFDQKFPAFLRFFEREDTQKIKRVAEQIKAENEQQRMINQKVSEMLLLRKEAIERLETHWREKYPQDCAQRRDYIEQGLAIEASLLQAETDADPAPSRTFPDQHLFQLNNLHRFLNECSGDTSESESILQSIVAETHAMVDEINEIIRVDESRNPSNLVQRG